jgi:hypothetical protein
MTSLPAPTKSPTSLSLTFEGREALIDFLAHHWLDGMTMEDLERAFYDMQVEHLQSYSDEELISEIEDAISAEDFQLLISEVESEA